MSFPFYEKRFFVAGSVSDRLLAYLIIAHSAKMLNRSKYSTILLHRINSKGFFAAVSDIVAHVCAILQKNFTLALNILHRDRLLLHVQILDYAKNSLH
jgi:hypothetical protein